MEVIKANANSQVADMGAKPIDKETPKRHLKTLGLNVLAVMMVIPKTEAAEYYYEDGVNSK
eukprot:8965869-Pyramimonas_sp.AAC.1